MWGPECSRSVTRWRKLFPIEPARWLARLLRHNLLCARERLWQTHAVNRVIKSPCHFVGFVTALCFLIILASKRVDAAAFVKADVTTLLGPSFFVDDAAAGGTDVTTSQPASGTYVRTFGGLLTANQGTTTVNLTGLGFAANSAAASNDATSVILAFTYLGADGVAGGGDDVVIGSTTVSFNYISAGEYACVFDTPLTATLNITATKFQIVVTPSNAGGTGSVNFKIGTLAYETFTGARLSVSGTVSGALSAKAKRLNVAKYQDVIADSENGNYIADYAADGVVANENSWRSANTTGPHTAEVSLPVTISVRSAHVYLGIDDGSAPTNFKVQYYTGSAWADAPGSLVTGNTATEVNTIFSSAVTASRFRFYTDGSGTQRVKEFALFRTNPDPNTGTELGYPIGTDVELNLAKKRPAVASAVSGTNYAKLAVDGYVSTASKWQTTTVGTNTLDIDLRNSSKIGGAHLYSGDGSVAPISDFTLQYWTGSAWANIAGGAGTGNTSAARVITFTTAPTTSQVRLTFNNPGTSAVRELCLFPANAGAGYTLGQDVVGAAPPTQKFEDYNDGFYQVINRAAGLAMSVNGTAPALDPGGLDAELSQYQVLLNVGTNTYRLRNRSTGKCLAGATLTTTAGAALVDQNYTAMPHQNWRLISVDGTDFYLLNDWSGLVVDTALAATTAGTGLVQQVMTGATTQHWRFVLQTHYPKKGMAGFINRLSDIKGDWGYNWGRTNSVGLPTNVVFHPMQWGNFNWNTLEQLVPAWKREDKSMHVLGFNEPDGADQANIAVADAITYWPRLERTDLPLVSPVTINPDATWMDDFMTQAQGLGYRMDVVAAHKYPDPNGGSSDALVNWMQTLYTTWGRPVWLTEFSTVDWGAATSAETSGTTQNLNGVWGSSSTSIWAVGAGGTILKSNGTTWTSQTSNTAQAFNGVWGSSATSVWAVGDGGTIMKFNGTTWSAQSSGVTENLNAVWGSDASNVWAVGTSGTILKFNGTTWTPQTSNTTQALNGVWGASATSVWAVGATGTVLKFNGTAWSAQTSSTTQNLNGVWGSSATSVWSVGDGGTILKHNGTTWTAQTSGTTDMLNSVRGTDANNVWAAGASGTRLRTTSGGSLWSESTTGTQALNGVWGSDANHVWTVGGNGTILITSGGTATWTEEDNYNWLAEFMWRAESLTWLRRFSLFLFTASADQPEPTNPTDTVGPRSNAFQGDGTTPTAFGELYFAWDGDDTVRSDKPYFVHNKAERKRLQNAFSSTGPSERWIRDGSNVTQWVLRPSPTSGQYYITSLRDGRRLRYTGSALNFAPANTTGTAVQWSLIEDVNGWSYIENPAAAASTRRLRDVTGTFSMASNTTTTDNVKWRFIVPYAPAENAVPATLTGLTTTAGDAQVSLTWSASSSTDFAFYSVYRSTTPGGPYTLVATNLTAPSYTNTALQNGTIYYYSVTATDRTGYESVQSTASTVTPVIATLPATFTASASNGTFTVTWPATHLGWILESQVGGLSPNSWTTVPNTTTTTTYSAPITPSTPSTFFRLKHP